MLPTCSNAHTQEPYEREAGVCVWTAARWWSGMQSCGVVVPQDTLSPTFGRSSSPTTTRFVFSVWCVHSVYTVCAYVLRVRSA
jgi:hypothetical protein